MGKTSIDGIAVRTSSPARRVSAARNTRQVGGSLAETSSRRGVADITMRPKKNHDNLAEDEFLAPVSGFGFDDEEVSLGTKDDSNWSDLLDQFADTGRKSNRKSKARNDEPGLDGDLFYDEDEEDTPKKAKRNHKTKKRKKIRPRHVLLFLFIAIIGVGIGLYVWGDQLIARLTGGNSGLFDTLWAMVSEEVPFETDANGRTNVLVFGTEGFNMDGDTGNGGVHDGAQLTDSILVVSFDQKTKDMALLSLPRDLKVPMACSAGKVNEVFWCNNQDGQHEEAGAQALMTQISKVTGIDFQYWAHVNWGSVVEIVNTLGGVTVTLDEDIYDYGHTGVVIKAGVPTTLDGIGAVALARARYGTNGGDFTRGNSQQKIVEAIAQKVVENGVGLSEAMGLLNILGDNLRTNFSADNIKSGMSLVSGFNPAAIRNVPLADYDNNIFYVNTATINEVSYVVPSAGQSDYSQIHSYIRQMFSSNPAVREGSQIAIYNATDTGGLAGAEQTKLEAEGYTVSNIGDSAAGGCEAEFCVYALTDKPATRAALEEKYQVVSLPAENLPTDIWPGVADFVIVIGRAVSAG